MQLQMNARLQQIFIHLIGWILFMALPLLFLPGPKHLHQLTDARTISDLLRYFLLIGFFYLNYHLLVPRWFYKNKWIFGALVVGVYLFIVYVPGVLMWLGPPPSTPDHMPPPPDDLPWDFAFKFGRHLILFLLVFTFSLMLHISDRLKNTEHSRRKAEIAYLQSQVNPHFLFNTLNSIYSLAIIKSDQAPAAVVKLSNMMRYVLTDASQAQVPLEKEIEYLKNYIDLQKLRFSASLQLDVHITGNAEGKHVAPLLFIPFIENAFKYGVNPEEQSHIKIEIGIEPHEVHVLVENKKVHVKHVEQTGTGIENTRQRLQLLYANKHLLTVSENENLFTVSLLIITT